MLRTVRAREEKPICRKVWDLFQDAFLCVLCVPVWVEAEDQMPLASRTPKE